MSNIVRYARTDTGEVSVGLQESDGIVPVASSLAELLRLTRDELRSRCASASGQAVPAAATIPLPPIDGRTEVWAAGVTYRRSREARMTESATAADVYDRVYDAERPELFFKSAAWRVVGHGEMVSVRADSEIDVPEPELALVVNAHGEIVGYTICDDVSSRTIEGDNPLYLPQAKSYLGACAIGPAIRPGWEVADPYGLPIRMAIRRGGAVAWSGQASTGQLHRRLDDLVRYLFAENLFPDGVMLATGTCLVPDLPFTLSTDDEVEIEIGEIGVLATRVVRGSEGMGWLVDAIADPRKRRRTP